MQISNAQKLSMLRVRLQCCWNKSTELFSVAALKSLSALKIAFYFVISKHDYLSIFFSLFFFFYETKFAHVYARASILLFIDSSVPVGKTRWIIKTEKKWKRKEKKNISVFRQFDSIIAAHTSSYKLYVTLILRIYCFTIDTDKM